MAKKKLKFVVRVVGTNKSFEFDTALKASDFIAAFAAGRGYDYHTEWCKPVWLGELSFREVFTD
jgi:hypothetical protein